jgi:hypothetical protein
MEREKAKQEAAESPSSGLLDKTTNGHQTPSARQDDPASSRSRRDTSVSDPSRTPADDIDNLPRDIPNTVGSETSSTSMASSMTNGSLRPNGIAAPKSSSYSHLTPLTTIDSPSTAINSHPSKPTSHNVSYPEKTNGSPMNLDGVCEKNPAVDKAGLVHRVPARDPSLRTQVIKSIHEPSTDRSSRDKKKPKYKEFGLVRSHHILYPAMGSVIF